MKTRFLSFVALCSVATALSAFMGCQSGGALVTSLDAGVVDAGPDQDATDASDAKSGCSSNADCALPTGVCDVATGICVECTAADPTCPSGKYCDVAAQDCKQGCANDADCNVAMDAGAALVCDMGTHTCVGCSKDADCPPGALCSASKCVPGCTQDHACSQGEGCCSDACIDILTDIAHCGSCDACNLPNATPVCNSGVCNVSACAGSYADCDGNPKNGCEVDTAGDVAHCGGCGTPCAIPNGAGQCVGGTCGVLVCAPGYADCDSDVTTGCETNIDSDIFDCGACNVVCMDPPGAQSQCTAGVCNFGGCGPAQADCNKNKADGCEIDLANDPDHCGNCAVVCPLLPNATPGCFVGVCGISACDPGYGNCDLVTLNGCEALTDTDELNCGACGFACPAIAHGTPGCASSMCVVGACDPGYADCDSDPSNGCEVNVGTDPQNCGACGFQCPSILGASAGCSSFVCGLGACDPGLGDCYGGLADGCETSLDTDVNNCGACGLSCPQVANGTRGCAAGVCGVGSCDAGHADCDGNAANGCEVDATSDLSNCGNCGNTCGAVPNGSPGCTAGACGVGTCSAGFSDCDSNPGNGCEQSTASDPNNCGGCGVVCGSGQCTNSSCICSKKVLIIRDDSASGAADLVTAFSGEGYTVTTTSVPSYQYDGTNPPTSGFGSIVLLAGGPASSSYNNDMPAGGQNAIVSFVNAGNGLVVTEWAAYHVDNGRWQTLAPLVLLQRTNSFIGQVTITVDQDFANHPLWNGVASSFTLAAPVNVGLAVIAPGVTRIATSPEALDAVVIRELAGTGRVVHVTDAGNYQATGWTNANLKKLMTNAAGWSARCL